MQRLQAYKYELMPDGQQKRDMSRFSGSCRFVYNKALALQKEYYESQGKKHSYSALCKMLTQWRASTETLWLCDSPSQALQQSLKDLDRAYTNFFAKRADFPRFKKKGVCDSFRYPDPKQIKLDEANGRIFLPKLGWMRYRKSCNIQGVLRNVTVSLRAGKWFVSIQTRREVEKPLPKTTSTIGIDMGVIRFATFSDGNSLAPLNSFKRHEIALRKAQQSLSRKKKFSGNWGKTKRKVQRLHARIGNARLDYLHKATTIISKNHAMVCIEDLQVRNMSKSAAGTREAPGRNVRAKSGLNKAILDQGWFEFRRQLQYKLDWSGGILIAVPPQNTSRTCPACGHVSKNNRRTQAHFACVECGYENNADVVGAINILRAGHARLACEVNRNGGQQQEPTEVIQQSDNASLDAVGIPRL